MVHFSKYVCCLMFLLVGTTPLIASEEDSFSVVVGDDLEMGTGHTEGVVRQRRLERSECQPGALAPKIKIQKDSFNRGCGLLKSGLFLATVVATGIVGKALVSGNQFCIPASQLVSRVSEFMPILAGPLWQSPWRSQATESASVDLAPKVDMTNVTEYEPFAFSGIGQAKATNCSEWSFPLAYSLLSYGHFGPCPIQKPNV